MKTRQTNDRLFIELYHEHQQTIRNVLLGFLRATDPTSVDDVMQDTVIKCLPAFQPDLADSFRYWFIMCAKRNVVNLLRRRKVAWKNGMREESDLYAHAPRGPEAIADQGHSKELPSGVDSEDVALRKEQLRLVWQAMSSLNEIYRETFRLWFFEGLVYKEVAKAQAIPLGSVMSRIYRAKRLIDVWFRDRHETAYERRWAA